MNKLPDTVIRDMVFKFIAVNTDEQKQTVVDQLGFHPVNHAMFAYELGKHHPHYWLAYLNLTKNLDTQ